MRFSNFDVRLVEAKPSLPIWLVRFVEAPCAFFLQIAVSSRRRAFCKLVDPLWNLIWVRPYHGSLRFSMVAEFLLFTNRRLVETPCVLQIRAVRRGPCFEAIWLLMFLFSFVISSRRRAFLTVVVTSRRGAARAEKWASPLVEARCGFVLRIVVSSRRRAS